MKPRKSKLILENRTDLPMTDFIKLSNEDISKPDFV